MKTIRSSAIAPAAAAIVLAGAIAVLGMFSSLAWAAPGDAVTTGAATAITADNAQLNGTSGWSPASTTAFWVATSTFTPVGGPSPTLPSGVYSTGVLPGIASSTSFSAPLGSTTVPSALPIEAGTTYYYTAWVQIDGVWTPGEVLSVTTNPAAPTISNIQVSGITASGATVTWTTDTPATSQVSYGTTTSYGSNSAIDTTATTSHAVTLAGLQEGALYHFVVMSGNITGTTTSSDQSFTTTTTGSTTPLTVTSIETLDSSAVADGTFENGWRYRLNFTVPTNEDAFRIQFTNWFMVGASSTTFATANNMRVSSPESSNASTTASAVLVTGANTYSNWLYLIGDNNTAIPGRQVSVIVEARIPVGTTPGTYSTNFVANTTPQSATSTTP